MKLAKWSNFFKAAYCIVILITFYFVVSSDWTIAGLFKTPEKIPETEINYGEITYTKYDKKNKKWIEEPVNKYYIYCIENVCDFYNFSIEEKAYAYATAKAETNFDPDAISHTQAIGWYQLKIFTACDRGNEIDPKISEEIKRDLKNKYRKYKTLKQVHLNAFLGIGHINWILKNKEKFNITDWTDLASKYSSKGRAEDIYLETLKKYYYKITGRHIREVL